MVDLILNERYRTPTVSVGEPLDRNAKMTDQIIQELKIQLKGGQTVVVNFKAEKADVLNPQVEAFLKACGDKEKQAGNFLFQGARIVLVRLADVSAAEVVSYIAKEGEKK